jgi:hypothetical protein
MSQVKYFPFTGEPYRVSMGLKGLLEPDWLERDEHRATHAELKRRLLRERKGAVFHLDPSVSDAAFELNEMVREFGLKYWPDIFSGSTADLRVEGRAFRKPASADQALAELSELAQEDFVIMNGTAPVTLKAALLCFPSRWLLADKVGRGSDEIHVPVPQFDAIAKMTATYLERVQVEKPMWRLNWTIHDSDQLFAPPGTHGLKPVDPEKVLEQTHLRIERQTLRRLPHTKHIVFTIRTYVNRMSDVVGSTERREALYKTLEVLHPDVAAYKGMSAFIKPLLAALREPSPIE